MNSLFLICARQSPLSATRMNLVTTRVGRNNFSRVSSRTMVSVNSIVDNQEEDLRVGMPRPCVDIGKDDPSNIKVIDSPYRVEPKDEAKPDEKKAHPHHGHKKGLMNEDFSEEASWKSFATEGPNPCIPTGSKKTSC